MVGNRHDYGKVGKRLLVCIRVVTRPGASESRIPKLQVRQQMSEETKERMVVAVNLTLGPVYLT